MGGAGAGWSASSLLLCVESALFLCVAVWCALSVSRGRAGGAAANGARSSAAAGQGQAQGQGQSLAAAQGQGKGNTAATAAAAAAAKSGGHSGPERERSEAAAVRQWFHVLLGMGAFTRAVCVSLELWLFQTPAEESPEYAACPAAWSCALVRTLPDLFFWTALSLVSVFIVQLRRSKRATISLHVFKGLLVTNAVLYLTVIVLACLAWPALNAWRNGGAPVLSADQFALAMFAVLGLAYLALWGCMLAFGVAFVSAIHSHKRHPAYGRVVVLLCTTLWVFTARCVYYATTLIEQHHWPLGYPPAGMGKRVFDLLLFGLVELLPAVVIMVLFTTPVSSRAPSSMQNLQHAQQHPHPHAVQSLAPGVTIGPDSYISIPPQLPLHYSSHPMHHHPQDHANVSSVVITAQDNATASNLFFDNAPTERTPLKQTTQHHVGGGTYVQAQPQPQQNEWSMAAPAPPQQQQQQQQQRQQQQRQPRRQKLRVAAEQPPDDDTV